MQTNTWFDNKYLFPKKIYLHLIKLTRSGNQKYP
jgi:hypothetical protein